MRGPVATQPVTVNPPSAIIAVSMNPRHFMMKSHQIVIVSLHQATCRYPESGELLRLMRFIMVSIL